MNMFSKFGFWLECRRVLRQPDLDHIALEFTSLKNEVENKINLLPKNEDMTQKTLKEFALINVRLNRLELLVGLKREPEALKVPDTARIS